MIKKIYCAGGNKRFAEIAIEAGFLYGSQVPEKIYYNTFFLDQNWKSPNKTLYIETVKNHQPYMATVIDIECGKTKAMALEWAEEIAPYVGKIVIIPKIEYCPPTKIAGTDVIVGYSVPTRYGGTRIPFEFFQSRKVHLLGGSPHKQMELFMAHPQTIYSFDGNYHMKIALNWCSVWELGTKRAYGMWTRLEDYLGKRCNTDCPYIAFKASCENILKHWQVLEAKYL